MRNEIDHQEKILARLLEWIRASDARVPPIAALNTAMLGVFAVNVPSRDEWTWTLVAFGTSTVVSLIASLVLLAIATWPRTHGPEGSLTFFEGIKRTGLSGYRDAMTSLKEEDYLVELIEQSYRNAEIASSKFRFVRFAMSASFIGILLWLPTLYFLFTIKE